MEVVSELSSACLAADAHCEEEEKEEEEEEEEAEEAAALILAATTVNLLMYGLEFGASLLAAHWSDSIRSRL